MIYYDYGEMIGEGVMITGEESMQPKDNAERLSAMNSSSIKNEKDDHEKRGVKFEKSAINGKNKRQDE